MSLGHDRQLLVLLITYDLNRINKGNICRSREEATKSDGTKIFSIYSTFLTFLKLSGNPGLQ